MRVEGIEQALHAMRGIDRPLDVEWVAIEPREPPPTAAVDGSHAVLVDTGAVWIVATRAAVATDGRSDPPMQIHGCLAGDAQDLVDQRYVQRGLTSPPVRSAEAFATALRSLDELDAAFQAIRDLPEGGLLLVDGATTGLPPGPQEIADRILDRATASGVHLAGVSKRSGLADADGPLLPRLRRAAGPVETPVVTRLAGCFGAVLHPQSPHAFRIDCEEQVLAWLVAMSNDAVYVGYPYPLAKAHNTAAITHAEARRVRERVLREAGPHAWALDDFHAVLDRNVAR